jgi:hypothetical protein
MSHRPIVDLIGRCRNRVALVGIELEGGWKEHPKGPGHIVRDGSVHFNESTAGAPADIRALARYGANTQEELLKLRAWQMAHTPQVIGELPSPPLPWRGDKTATLDAIRWVRTNYPPFVNETCGLHMHMSFKHLGHYQRLLEPGFQNVMIEQLTLWAREALPAGHAIFRRLSGDSTYCQHRYFGDEQAALKEKRYDRDARVHRYTVINYSAQTHQTIECRVLPMMDDAETAIAALQRVLDITNAYLVSNASPEPVVRVDVPVDAAPAKGMTIALEV